MIPVHGEPHGWHRLASALRLDLAVCRRRGHRRIDSGVRGWDWCTRCGFPYRRYPQPTPQELRFALFELTMLVRQQIDLDTDDHVYLRQSTQYAADLLERF